MKQIDLFSAVMHAYADSPELSNAELYDKIKSNQNLDLDDLNKTKTISGQPRNLLERKIRWHQQSLKQLGIIEKDETRRSIWHLTEKKKGELSQILDDVAVLGFSTDLGIAILGSCEHVFSQINAPISLIITSPPYPLKNERNYGNVSESVFVKWICETLAPVIKNMNDGASICLNLGQDIFQHKLPSRSMYIERLLLALNDEFGLQLMDRLIWNNPSKPPGPIQWASKTRYQLNVGYEPVFWLTNNPLKCRSNNQRVLQAHSDKHMKLMLSGGEVRRRVNSDGAYIINPGAYGNVTQGKIPTNVLNFGHGCKDQREYKQHARDVGLIPNGASMPLKLAMFLIEFLTESGELIADPFGGSFTSAKAAELLGRKWISTEKVIDYVIGGAYRFKGCLGFTQRLAA